MKIASTYPLRDIIDMLAREMFHEDRDEINNEFISRERTVYYDVECELRVLRDGTKSLQLDIKVNR